MNKQKNNISQRVMDKIVAFEEKRSSFFLWNYNIALIIVLIFIVAVFLGLYWELVYRKAFDLLSLFSEDWETIREYWADTLGMFYEEVPGEYIGYLGVGVVLISTIILLTKPIRGKLRRTIEDIAQFKRNES